MLAPGGARGCAAKSSRLVIWPPVSLLTSCWLEDDPLHQRSTHEVHWTVCAPASWHNVHMVEARAHHMW